MPNLTAAFTLCLFASMPGAAGDCSIDDHAAHEPAQRVIKVFDFDEAARGNFESTPMHWALWRGSGFPPYVTARFDPDAGKTAPPSFYLGLLGGNVSAEYRGREIPVRPDSAYRVTAWIRPDRLVHARAFLCAYYRDGDMRVIPTSERRSELLSAEDAGASWRPVVIDLDGGYADARWLGLSCRVLQHDALGEAEAAPRPIRRIDVHGGAWFDDIAVVRLPMIALDFGRNPTVFQADEPIRLSVGFDDPQGARLESQLTVLDAEERRIIDRPLPLPPSGGAAADLSMLPPGWYRVEVAARSGARVLCHAQAALLRLPRESIEARADRRDGIGAALSDWPRDAGPAVRALLETLGASAVKIPFWTARTCERDLVEGQRDNERFLRELVNEGVQVVGVLAEPPADLAARFDPARRTLLDILAAPPKQWRAHLSLPAARSGEAVRHWQVGPDAVRGFETDPRWVNALEQVRDEIDALSGRPAMAAPWNALHELMPAGLPAQFLSLYVPDAVPPESIPPQVTEFGRLGYAGVWTTLPPLALDRYAPRAWLADLARRLVLTRASGASRVFVPPPWTARTTGASASLEPSREFLLIRALTAAWAGSVRALNLSNDPQTAEWLFTRPDGGGSLVVWRSADELTPLRMRRYLGPHAREYDHFGRRVSSADDGGAPDGAPDSIAADYLPRIYTPVDAELLTVQASIRLARPAVSPGIQFQENELIIANGAARPLRGRLEWTPPEGWQSSPAALTVALAPGSTGRYPLRLRIPTNQPAGRRALVGRLQLNTPPYAALPVDLAVDVAAADLEVRVLAQAAGDRMVVRQRITNRSAELLDLEGFVAAPGRKRLTALIRGIAPGQTVERRYEMDQASALRGVELRVGLEQINGPRRHNEIIPIG